MDRPGTAKSQDVRAVRRVLESLDRWSRRLENFKAETRSEARFPFRTQVTICLAEDSSLHGTCNDALKLQVWSRNLSQTGICFLHDGPIIQTRIVVYLKNGERPLLFRSEIVRSRRVDDRYWEYGVRFVEPV